MFAEARFVRCSDVTHETSSTAWFGGSATTIAWSVATAFVKRETGSLQCARGLCVRAEAGTSQEIEVVVPEGMGAGEPHPQT